MKVDLKDVADVQIGYQPRCQLANHLKGSHLVIQMRDFDAEGCFHADTLARVTPETDTSRYAVRDGDVVFQARGTRNRAFVLRGVPAATLASNHFYIVRMRPNVALPQFLAWSVNLPSAQEHLMERAQGTTMMLVPKDAFESLEIDVPPLAVQRRISDLTCLADCERQLMTAIQGKREKLISAVCLRALKSEGGREG